MVMKQWEVTHEQAIHINGTERQPGETFEEDLADSGERPLVVNEYIKQVKR